MSKKNPDIQFTKGDAYEIPFEVIDLNEDAISISGAGLVFTVKRKASDPQSEAIIIKDNNGIGGVTIESDGITGEFSVLIDSSDTLEEDSRKYNFDVQMTLNGEIQTIINDYFEIIEDVTKP